MWKNRKILAIAMAALALILHPCANAPIRAAAQTLPLPVPVIMYHDFSDNAAHLSELVISPAMLAEDFYTIQRLGLTSITLMQYEELASAWMRYNKGELTNAEINALFERYKNPILITMDDGYLSWYTTVLPLAKRFNVHVNGFLFTAAVDEARFEGRRFINWQEAKEMQDSGFFTFGNHAYKLHLQSAAQLKDLYSTEEGRAAAMEDIKTAHCLAFENGIAYTHFAYPYGLYNKDMDRLIRTLYSATLSTEMRIASASGSSALPLPRYNRPSNESTWVFFTRLGREIYKESEKSAFAAQNGALTEFLLNGKNGDILVYDSERIWTIDGVICVNGRQYAPAAAEKKAEGVICTYRVGEGVVELGDNNTRIYKNGAPVGDISVPTIVRDGQLYVPVRNVFEVLGYSVSYDSAAKKTTIFANTP